MSSDDIYFYKDLKIPNPSKFIYINRVKLGVSLIRLR